MTTKKSWFIHSFFSLAEHGAIRVLDAIFTIMLIRVLSTEYFGQFSVYQSWVSLSLLFIPAIELALFREYGSLKSRGELNREFHAYKLFSYFKIFIAAVFIMLFAIKHSEIALSARMSLAALAFALPLSQSIYSLFQAPFRFEMRQNIVALGSTLHRGLMIFALGVTGFFLKSDLTVVVSVLLVLYIVFGFVWNQASLRWIAKEEISVSQAKKRVLKAFLGISLWIHLNGVFTSTVQTLDVLCLNAAKYSLEEIARYSLALKAANFFQIIPVALVSSFGIYLGKYQHQQKYKKEINTVVLLCLGFAMMAFLMFKVGMMFSEPILMFLGKNKLNADAIVNTKDIFRWQLLGVLMQSVFFPLSTYVGARASLKKMTGAVFVPWALMSYFIYHLASKQSIAATAKSNLMVYIALNVLLVMFFLIERKNLKKASQ